ncbi:MAG: hypothetical protein J5883_06635 [Clostridiales bacterium]|nr:hypothetical protein [Clostridiales bacterium]
MIRVLLAAVLCASVSVAVVACGGKTGPEYRYENFIIEEIRDGNAYVVLESQSGDPDAKVYAISLELFGDQIYESGSRIQVAYKDFDQGDENGLDAVFADVLELPAQTGQSTVESSGRSLPSRSYFENLDKESSLEEIVEEIGECGYEGSGIIYHVWSLDDGSEAKLVFNSDGQIEFIYIVTDESSERIYDRENP